MEQIINGVMPAVTAVLVGVVIVIIKNVAKISGLSNVADALDRYGLLMISNGKRPKIQSFML